MVQSTLDRVIACMAAATRYPIQLLTVEADLENDLGIDSVKNLEIVLSLADEFGLDLASRGRDPQIRTIGNVASWIESLLPPPVTVHKLPPVDAAPQAVPQAVQAQHRARIIPSSHPAAGAETALPAPPHFPVVRKPETREPLLNIPATQPLAGRIALITGSGRGVGKTIARVLAARGAQVIVNSFHSRDQGDQTTAEINAQGGQATHLWGSVANPEHVDRMFLQIEQQFGRLDILVCNASDGRIGNFLELTPQDWERAFNTNVSGHHQCAVRASGLMRTGGGSIITMSAVGADRYIAGLGSQGVVKAAVETLTRYLACELGRMGIRVNCVVGGPVYGDLLSKFPDAQSTQQHWESMTPDGELCSPIDLAHAIGFLVSDEARGINGSVWTVDHGFSANADGRPLRAPTRSSARLSLA
jgi:enoyl-[acyl-carrier protein] reductase III